MRTEIHSMVATTLVLTLSGAAFAVNVDIKFDDPGEPSAQGFAPAFAGPGTVDPTSNIAGGVWTNNLSDGQAAYFNGSTGGAVGTIVGPVFHGWAEITVQTWSTVRDDQTLFNHGDATTGGTTFFQEGKIIYFSPPAGTVEIPVSNIDGLKHTYGWEHDRTNHVIKLFFDGISVGDPNGYAANTAIYNGDMYFGDGTGGTLHAEIWDRVVMAEGAYPVINPAVPGDFDSDGDVDGADFVAWQTHFPTAMNATLADGDADGDGDVDGADFVVWQTNFPFTPSPSATAVPEPGSGMVLIALVGLRFATWRMVRRTQQYSSSKSL